MTNNTIQLANDINALQLYKCNITAKHLSAMTERGLNQLQCDVNTAVFVCSKMVPKYHASSCSRDCHSKSSDFYVDQRDMEIIIFINMCLL